MKKKLVLKPFVLPTIYGLLIISIIVLTAGTILKGQPEKGNEIELVTDKTLEDVIPVMDQDEVYVLNPYIGDNIKEKIGYYDYKGEKNAQEKSIIQYGATYLQNTGISYSSDKEFDVVSIMDGTVTKVYQNDLLGNIVEITHENNLISVYQMVDDIKVKEKDTVQAGMVIAKSGTSKIFNEDHNLHFEIIQNGNVKDPKTIIGKNIKDLK